MNTDSFGAITKMIARQMGGFTILGRMLGVHHFKDDNGTLEIKFPNKGLSPNYVRVTLDPSDTYSMEFGKLSIKKDSPTLTKKYSHRQVWTDVYSDMLVDVFESVTGLYLNFSGGPLNPTIGPPAEKPDDFIWTNSK
jgi:hypothetical protein